MIAHGHIDPSSCRKQWEGSPQSLYLRSSTFRERRRLALARPVVGASVLVRNVTQLGTRDGSSPLPSLESRRRESESDSLATPQPVCNYDDMEEVWLMLLWKLE